MYKKLLVILLVIIQVICFVSGFSISFANDMPSRIFYGEITKQGDTDIWTKYFVNDIDSKKKVELNSVIIKKVSNGMPRICDNGKFLAYFTVQDNKQYFNLLNITENKLDYTKEIPKLSGELQISNNKKYVVFYNLSDMMNGNSQEIMLLNLTNGVMKKITNNNLPDFNPIFSLSNDSVFFVEKDKKQTILKEYDINNGIMKDIQIFQGIGYHLFQYLKDDKLLLVLLNKTVNGVPFLYDIKSKQSTNLNFDRITDIAISPDGEKVVYLRLDGVDSGTWNLYISDINGQNAHIIPRAKNIDILAPQWVN